MAYPETIHYLNGEFVKENEAKFHWLDEITRGYGVFDVSRTYKHVPLFWEEHIDRLYRSLDYVHIDPGMTQEQMMEVSLEVLKRNEKNMDPADDLVMQHIISRGVADFHVGPISGGPTIMINCGFLSCRYAQDDRCYQEGVHLLVGNHRQYPPDALSSQAKHTSRLNFGLALYEARMTDPHAWAVLLNHNGFIAEGPGYNVFMIKDGKLFLPAADNILPGVTQGVTIKLAEKLGVELRRGNYTVWDLYAADEIFCTAATPGIVPVSKFMEKPKPLWGPVTKKLYEAFTELVGVDLAERVKQRITYD